MGKFLEKHPGEKTRENTAYDRNNHSSSAGGNLYAAGRGLGLPGSTRCLRWVRYSGQKREKSAPLLLSAAAVISSCAENLIQFSTAKRVCQGKNSRGASFPVLHFQNSTLYYGCSASIISFGQGRFAPCPPCRSAFLSSGKQASLSRGKCFGRVLFLSFNICCRQPSRRGPW